MGQLIENNTRMETGNYTNVAAVDNLIHYITRTRDNETKDDLIGYGAVGINMYDPELMIAQMKEIIKCYDDIQNHKKMCHAYYSLTESEVLALGWNVNAIMDLAQCLAEHYYRIGHVVAYAVHKSPNSDNGSCVHIHFAVCAVNYMTGNLYHASKREIIATNLQFNMRQKEYEERSAIRFIRPPMEGFGMCEH